MSDPRVVHEWSNRRLMEQENHPDYQAGYVKRWVEYRANTEWVEDIRIGISILDELARLAAELADIKECHARVMQEQCAPDERHCTCVPYLRAELAEVKAERDRLREALDWYRRKDGEWKCETCGSWYSDAFMYCTNEECRRAPAGGRDEGE